MKISENLKKTKRHWFQCCECGKRIYNELSYQIPLNSGHGFITPLCKTCYDKAQEEYCDSLEKDGWSEHE